MEFLMKLGVIYLGLSITLTIVDAIYVDRWAKSMLKECNEYNLEVEDIQ